MLRPNELDPKDKNPMLGDYDRIDLGPSSEVRGMNSLLENSLETKECALGVEEAKALLMVSQLSCWGLMTGLTWFHVVK